MTIGDDIAQWAGSRPIWQQEFLRAFAEGLPIPWKIVDVRPTAELET